MRNLSSILCVAGLCVVTIACGSDSSPTAPTNSYDGRWTGTTGQQLPISFTVAGSQISSFTFDYTFDYSGLGAVCRTTVTAAPGGSAPISGNTFRFTLNRPDGAVSTTVSGTFTSSNQVTGEFSEFTLTNLQCDTHEISATYSSVPRTFTAAKS